MKIPWRFLEDTSTKRETRPVIKRGTTDTGFSVFVVEVIYIEYNDWVYFFSNTPTSQYYIKYSSSFVMYLYKIRRFYVFFNFLLFGFDFKDLQFRDQGSRRQNARTHSSLKESSGQDSVGTQGSYT